MKNVKSKNIEVYNGGFIAAWSFDPFGTTKKIVFKSL